jgi:hypothetical protein
MADPLDPARLYERYLAAQKSRGLGDLFQEEGPGLGPSSQLSKVISTLRESGKGQIQSGMDPRIVNPQIERRIAEERQAESLRRIEELAPKGLEAEFAKIKSMQESSKFAGPEDNISRLERDKLRLQNAENLDLSNDFISPLDEIAEQIAKINAPTGASDEAIAQNIIAEKQRGQSAEEFRAEEERLAEGMMPEMGADPQNVQKALDETFASAMDDFINSVRGAGPDKKERTLDDYKKEFAEATGVDISGKVDKSSALMSMGLALMQNRAGKGFNVGRMLSAVGKAGSAALPALEKAKNKAQTAALAAGKYALESRGSDRAKDEAADLAGKRRGKYWVYKKGGKGTEFANFDDGEFVDLNPFELNKLIDNKDFDNQYEFIDASDRMSILEKRAEGVDLGDMWSGYERVSLIGGKADDVAPELQVLAAAADPNYKGLTPTSFKIAENPETVVRRFGELQQSITSGSAKFENLISAIDSGVSIPDQMVSTVYTGLRNLGFNVGDQPTDIAQARTMLKEIAVREATNILQESGKTLSDNDRRRVEDLVGEISFVSGDAALIKKKLKEIYRLTVEKPQENLDLAVSWMEQNAGIKFGPAQGDMPTEAELQTINENRKARGEQPLTMDDYK